MHVQTNTPRRTRTYTKTNTHAHQIGSRHRQSVSRPAELTNCMLKIVTHVGGSRAPRRGTTAWLCREVADHSHVWINRLGKGNKVHCLGMSWFLVLAKRPVSLQTNTAPIEATVFSTWLHVAHFSSLDMLMTLLILHESTALPRASTDPLLKSSQTWWVNPDLGDD